MFILTAANFLLFALHTGSQVGRSIVLLRNAFVEHTDLSLSHRLGMALQAVETTDLIGFWSINLIVRSLHALCERPRK
jgi:hypothetical protein